MKKNIFIKIINQMACFVVMQCAPSVINSALAREYFNPALLGIDGPGKELTDLSAFEEGVGQMPGTYRVNIMLNNTSIGTHNIEFITKKNAAGYSTLQPCLSVETLGIFGIQTEQFPGLIGKCADLAAIPQAKAEFIFDSQTLQLSVPQAAISNHAGGYVPPEQLDEGINALLLNYNFSGGNTKSRHSNMPDSDSYYLSLRPGMNIGPWRIRNYSTWNRSINGDYAQESWDSLYTYAQRNIIALQSQLTIGDSTAPSDMFDSVPFRGAQLASDDDMLPDSLRGYAPVVRGIARTNAQIIIKQSGHTIYQTYVSPGAFEITDMYPTGSSGDLDVTIKEADGSEQHQTVAFASLPVLQREGRLKYSLTGGQYRPYNGDIDKDMFIQTTAIYGLPAGFTLYGGGQFSQHYQSVLGGVGKNFGVFGAVSLDTTQAWSRKKDEAQESGQSLRVRYSKNIQETGTNIAISGYRYSTSDYNSLSEVLDTWRNDDWQSNNDRRRNRADLTITQNISENLGSLTLNAMAEDYWNSNKQMRSIGAGYSNSWGRITYNLNYSYNRNTTDSTDSDETYNEDQIFSFSINIPLDGWLNNSYASYSLNNSRKGNTSHTIGLNGSELEDRNLTWNLQQSQADNGEGRGGYGSLNYQGTYARVNTAYSYDNDQKRMNYGIEGGMVAHAHGITFSQALGETVALVEAPGADGVTVTNQTGVKTDFRGYTIVPYISPYRESSISLDTSTLPDSAEVELTTQSVTPTRGAIARAHFSTHIGKRVLMTLTRSNGAVVPFGAIVKINDKSSQLSAIVGDAGQVYLSGLEDHGELLAQWGRDPEQQCLISYQLPAQTPPGGVVESNELCHLKGR